MWRRKQAKMHPKLDDLILGAIKSNGTSATIADVCGYTIEDFRRHLERQFTKKMNWAAFMRGEIRIDHIVPQRLFDLATLDGVKACRALSNLRPLWAAGNLSKGRKVLTLL
jgi:hypothetical protein